jgi:hypothetical protein
MSECAPLPWKAPGGVSDRSIVDANGEPVVIVQVGGSGYERHSQDVRKLIVTACNTHDRLVAACEECAEGLERDARMYPDGKFRDSSRFGNRAARLRLAVLAAKGDPDA